MHPCINLSQQSHLLLRRTGPRHGWQMVPGDVGAEPFQQEVDQLRVAHQDTRIFEVRDT